MNDDILCNFTICVVCSVPYDVCEHLNKTNRRFTFQRERLYHFEPDQRKSSSNNTA